jgi:hypothetical protein
VRTIVGHIEQDPEYQLIVEANSLTLDITQEIQKLHKFIKEIYKTKFPELESIIYNPVEYAKAVQRIGNETVTPISTYPIYNTLGITQIRSQRHLTWNNNHGSQSLLHNNRRCSTRRIRLGPRPTRKRPPSPARLCSQKGIKNTAIFSLI